MHARHQLPKLAMIVLLLLTAATVAVAFPSAARKTKMSCATCHSNVSGGADLTDAGKAYKADNTKVPAASTAGAEYVGTNKCKMCHMKQYKAWQETKHAHAFENLTAADPKLIDAQAKAAGVTLSGSAAANDACLNCHVVGASMGGYPPADTSKTVSFANMGCEMCHGPGSKHVSAEKDVKKNFINGKPSEAMCKDCHTPAMSPKFAFEEYKTKGVHVVPAATQ